MMKHFLNFLFVGLILSACTFQTKQRGYVFPQNLNSEIEKVKTIADLEDKFGSPQAKTIHGDEVWVYYGATENFRGPMPKTYEDRTVMLAWVNHDTNKVSDIKILKDKDLPNIKIADGETQIPAAVELNAIQELFNNIGRFSPAGLGQ